MTTQPAHDTPLYSIGTAARVLGISVHTMRMYERSGLIVPFIRETNQRLYSERDIERDKQESGLVIMCFELINDGNLPFIFFEDGAEFVQHHCSGSSGAEDDKLFHRAFSVLSLLVVVSCVFRSSFRQSLMVPQSP